MLILCHDSQRGPRYSYCRCCVAVQPPGSFLFSNGLGGLLFAGSGRYYDSTCADGHRFLFFRSKKEIRANGIHKTPNPSPLIRVDDWTRRYGVLVRTPAASYRVGPVTRTNTEVSAYPIPCDLRRPTKRATGRIHPSSYKKCKRVSVRPHRRTPAHGRQMAV